MATPKRIQRKRTKGWRMPPNTIYVGRPSDFGNPFMVGDVIVPGAVRFVVSATEFDGVVQITERNCLTLFWLYAEQHRTNYPGWLQRIRGKDLACWCKEGSSCHADILLELANHEDTQP